MTANQITALRTKLRLTADEFAERLGLLGRYRALTVYKWESGAKQPGPQTIMLMKMLAKKQ